MRLYALVTFFIGFISSPSHCVQEKWKIEPFNATFARYQMYPLAVGAYAKDPKMCALVADKSSKDVQRFEAKCPVKATCVGYIAILHQSKAIAVVYQGSHKAGQTIGYTFQFLPWLLKQSLKTKKKGLTGHSLGGAMAATTAAVLSERKDIPHGKVRLLTFGTPAMGTKDFVSAMHRTYTHMHYVSRRNDPIPLVPPFILPHPGEIYYNNHQTDLNAYCVGKDSMNGGCQKKRKIHVNMDDHTYYYNLHILKWAEQGCKGTTSLPGWNSVVPETIEEYWGKLKDGSLIKDVAKAIGK